jgi:hypothetical protein
MMGGMASAPEGSPSLLAITQKYETTEETLRRVRADLAEISTKLPAAQSEYMEMRNQMARDGWLGLASSLAVERRRGRRRPSHAAACHADR